MLDLFKEVTYLYNLRNSLIYTETITYLDPNFWSVVSDKMKESASLETLFKKINLWKPDSSPCRFLKNNALQMLASLIFHVKLPCDLSWIVFISFLCVFVIVCVAFLIIFIYIFICLLCAYIFIDQFLFLLKLLRTKTIFFQLFLLHLKLRTLHRCLL